MRIAFYHERAAHWHSGGVATFIQEMARALSAYHDVRVYSGPGEITGTLSRSDVDVVTIPPLPYESHADLVLNAVPGLSKQLRVKSLTFLSALCNDVLEHMTETNDIVLTQQWLDDVLISNNVDVPIVYEFHGVQSAGIGSRFRERCSDTTLHLANSAFTATNVERLFGRQVDAVVSPGVDTAVFQPCASPAFDRVPFSVLFVGRVTAEKGIYDLLEAFSLIPDAHLDIVGGGDLAGVRRYASQLGIDADVTVHGIVPHDELPRYYTAADVICLPTHYESFGMVALEAMACGAAVVTSDIGGIQEYATHERDCILVPPQDGNELTGWLLELERNPEVRERLGTAARTTAESNAWSKQAKKLATFCESAVEADARSANIPW